MSIFSYQPWQVVGPYTVPVEGEHGDAVVVLPYVAAQDINALWVTATVLATKAVYDVGVHMEKTLEAASKSQRQLQIENLRKIKWEPPLQRFKCESCNYIWDAWISEDGSLEDPWSCVCTNGRCTAHGSPAVIYNEEDE